MKLSRTVLIFLIGCISAATFAASSSKNEQMSEQEMIAMLDMLDQLDQLDRLDFQDALEKATSCISKRLYHCAEKNLAEAAKYASGNSDKAEIAVVRQDLAAERKLEAREIKLAEQRKRDEERRERERRREAERLRRLALEREMEMGSEETSFAGAFAAGLNQGLSDLAVRNEQRNQEINAAIRQAYAMKEKQNREYLAEQRRVQEREVARQRQQQQQLKQQRDLAEQRREAEAERRRQRELARQREADKLAMQREKERQKQERERQRQAEKRAKEQQRQERERQREAEALAKDQAKQAYLDKLLAGTKLGAKRCYGDIFVGGRVPDIKPELVGCIDVHYRAVCPKTSRSVTTVFENFQSNYDIGCWGEIDKITKDLGCNADELRVTAQKVTACQ